MGYTYNINLGNILEHELIEYCGKGQFVYAKYRDDITKTNSSYVNKDYYHPEMGEKLHVKRAFCPENNFNNCYYIELHGKDGHGYYYTDESKVMSQDGEKKIIQGKTLDRQLVKERLPQDRQGKRPNRQVKLLNMILEHTLYNNGYSGGL